MKRWKIVSIFCLGIVLLLAGFVAFVLPGMVKSETVPRVEAATGRKLSIGAIAINPFTMTVMLRDVGFTERGGGKSFAAFSSARIEVSPASLYRMKPVIAAARITAPRLSVVRVGANLYNFTDLLKFLPLHPRLSVSNLTVTNGSLDFIDRALPAEKRHELRKIELYVPFVTTMPQYADRYLAPRLSAVLNGSPFQLEGRLRPFPRAVEATATVKFSDVSLPSYLAYLPAPLPIQVASGRISGKLALDYRGALQENPELTLKGSLTLADLQLAYRTGAPFLAVTRLDAELAGARLPGCDFELSSLYADGLELFLSRDRKGVWSNSRLAAAAYPGAATRRVPLASVKQTRLRNGRLHFNDALAPGGFKSDLAGVSLDVRDFSTSPGKRASYALSFSTLRGEKGELAGDFSPAPFATSSKVKLSGVPLEAYYPYLPWAERSEVRGKFAFAGDLDFDPQKGLLLDKVSARARPFATLIAGKARVTRASFSLDGGSYSRRENLLEVTAAGLGEGDLRFSRLRTGGLRPLGVRRGKSPLPPPAKRAGLTPFSYRIGRISGSGLRVLFTDEMLAARPSFALTEVAFSLERLAGPPFGPSPFRVAGSYGKVGVARASGDLSQKPLSFTGDLAVQRIPLADFGPYLPGKLNMRVADGKVDARLAGFLAIRAGRLAGSFDGSAGVRSLRCLDSEGGDLLKWDDLRLDGVKGTLAPYALDIGAATLTRLYSRIVVAKDGSLNLQQLYSREPEEKERQKAAAGAGHPVRIDRFTMRDGTLSFTDHHVTGGYATTLYNLEGHVTGLSSEENRLADLDLRANQENRSPLRITGVINPLRQELFADLKVSFAGIELPPMTPYSGTYLGYAVNRGKLFLDSRYRIVNKKLNAENRVFIDQLDLGRRIASDQATALPVRLAVALLKDRKGEIRLDLPVTGRTDDPRFSLWEVALKVLKNLVVKAASSPLAVLRTLFGAKDDWSGVVFAPGSAALSAGEREKLLKLAAALNDRPSLRIKVIGYVDREADAKTAGGEKRLRGLADARAAGVRVFLIEQGRLASSRVAQGSGDSYLAPAQGGEPGSRVEFEITAE